jgi:hypothetical protein
MFNAVFVITRDLPQYRLRLLLYLFNLRDALPVLLLQFLDIILVSTMMF